ncbi:MAG: bifunctional adenosylcobinamide kinase/adenosylcobinamide-phosphate guanylyltransferase [Candidatus Caldatribacterium sp.]|uniref:bifunctional adenosylcobinamide kinase/adenosylcobinamide-phosphate guanylyltransferase n=1 Tax=Candidatus Caldatribacterium sp. TaxID=2282143 RepID=UPI00299A0B28|nr:bifunctional adenosylcobinamide kinase/adenosylcobinamide-phosphate guanylyltransferase [Candidatus Caldatribacterium sp.]MCX7731289.1 bifunctional adenosylcobinamide kinase/adenosylcobinamide-phosphate guanylyltransferase [Candidatus Caldatribacterium sp.]MDW8081145.1 bifunctional adenosylcobinamide kinase/adenosylcobinamide-phosphate guanylyltransferase [Candidatus Calescibacterium sp.]
MGAERVLILGGARSGKSRLALTMVGERGVPVVFCATGIATDPEMEERIRRHRSDRPSSFITVEVPYGFVPLLSFDLSGKAVLLDCVSFLVSNILLQEKDEKQAYEKVLGELTGLFSRQEREGFYLVLVSNEVGMGVVPEFPLGRAFRDLLGRVNQWLAERADRVYFVVAGIPWQLK